MGWRVRVTQAVGPLASSEGVQGQPKFVARLACQRQPVRKVCASDIRRVAHVRERLLGVEREVVGKAVRQFAERAVALR